MTENNAAQPGLTEAELDAIHAPMQNYAACNINVFTYIARAIESALLSKLRAEGVQAGAHGAIPPAKPLPDLMMASYHEAIGWNACRDAMLTTLASPPVAVGSAAQEFIDAVDALLASEARETWTPAYKQKLTTADRMRIAETYRRTRAALASAPVAGSADRAMLRSVLRDLERSDSVCPQCGHSDSCADMDVAYMIRDHLKGEASAPVAGEPAVHPEIQAVLAMLDVPVIGYLGSHSGKLLKSADMADRFESAIPLVSESAHRAACEKIIAALPTPSVVKQSLTATQTGEAAIYVDEGHLREVLAGNDMPVSASTEPGHGMVRMYAAPMIGKEQS